MKKLSLSIAALTVALSSAFAAQHKNPCSEIENGFGIPYENTCYPAGYNATADIILKDQIDFTGQVSFIYWYVGQGDMSVGSHSHTSANGITESIAMYPEFEFKPGFKVGGAVDTKYDDWRLAAEYTWLHQSTHHAFHVEGSPEGVANKTAWKMHLDMLDFGINRAFYRSKRITVSPTAGLKALWIRQNLNTEFNNTANATNKKSHSWALGPNFSTNVNFLFDYGMRFEGKAGAAVLYTRYTQLSTHDVSLKKAPNYGAVRPMAELGFGLGWGTYLDSQNYYIDLSARYDFNVFWSQNQLDAVLNFKAENLYMHGLTLTGRFDF